MVRKIYGLNRYRVMYSILRRLVKPNEQIMHNNSSPAYFSLYHGLQGYISVNWKDILIKIGRQYMQTHISRCLNESRAGLWIDDKIWAGVKVFIDLNLI